MVWAKGKKKWHNFYKFTFQFHMLALFLLWSDLKNDTRSLKSPL